METANSKAPKPRTILYIEDDPASRKLIERALKHAGYRVLVAERGLDGIDLALSDHPDLILTDINLPDLSGREVTTRLRSEPRFSKTPIVALTAQAMEEQREVSMASGLDGYLTKPVDVETLPDKIEYYLKGGHDEVDDDTMSRAQVAYTQEVVTRLEERIRELETVNKELRRLDSMKDTFIQLTAHELRTPLTLVFGYSRLLEDTPEVKVLTDADPSMKTLIEGMSEAIKRMQSIINEIVTISRIMTNQIDLSVVTFDLGAVMQKVLSIYRPALEERRLKVHFDRKQFPRDIRADLDLLQLALDNLLSNAIKFTPDRGEITLSAQVNKNHVVVRIRDTGIGIDESEQKHIFERFHTTNDLQLHSTSKTAYLGGGIGLGLAVCRGIIEAHGGHITVKSERRDERTLPGSEFIVTLPLVTQSGKRKTTV